MNMDNVNEYSKPPSTATCLVNRWLGKDESTYRQWWRLTQDAIGTGRTRCGEIRDRDHARANAVAHLAQQLHRSLLANVSNITGCLYTELLHTAMDDIDWWWLGTALVDEVLDVERKQDENRLPSS